MSDDWLEMEFFGFELSKVDAVARFPQLQTALADIGIDHPALSWNDDRKRIVVTFKSLTNSSDELLDDETHERMWDALIAVYPEAFEEPGAIEDDTLGTLYWDDGLQAWVAEVQVTPEREIEVALDPQDGDVDVLIQRTKAFVAEYENRELSIRHAAAEFNLLDMYNDLWSHGATLTRDAFVEHLALQSITFRPNGATLRYDDSDLFGLHLVVIDIDVEGRITDTSLMG